jgi:hypothetical protein
MIHTPQTGASKLRRMKRQMYDEEKKCPLKAAVKASTDYECDKRCAWYDECLHMCAILMLAQATAFSPRN